MEYNFKITYTPLAVSTLRSIGHYIENELKEPETAKKILSDIVRRIDDLAYEPFMYRLYEDEPWRSRGVRHFPVGSFIVYYHADNEARTVWILKIAYGGQSSGSQLRGI